MPDFRIVNVFFFVIDNWDKTSMSKNLYMKSRRKLMNIRDAKNSLAEGVPRQTVGD